MRKLQYKNSKMKKTIIDKNAKMKYKIMKERKINAKKAKLQM